MITHVYQGTIETAKEKKLEEKLKTYDECALRNDTMFKYL